MMLYMLALLLMQNKEVVLVTRSAVVPVPPQPHHMVPAGLKHYVFS